MYIVSHSALGIIYPSPFNSARYVYIVAGTSRSGFCFYDSRRNDLAEYDYYLVDGVMPDFAKGIKNEDVIIASGFFDRGWKFDKALLNEGDESVRSKCAMTLVNDDLSTRIEARSKPSPEQLNSYTGKYIMEGGFSLEIFIEKNILKGRANGPAANLVPISENEFYAKEANATCAFMKNEKTDDMDIILYQMGRELKGTKAR